MNEETVKISITDLELLEKIIKERKNPKIIIDLTFSENLHPMDAPEIIVSDNIDFFKLLKKQHANIFFQYDTNIFSLDKVLEDEIFLEKIADEINSYELSPLERHIAVYSIVSNFKAYTLENEKTESYHLSRSLYEYMNNNFFCCAGAANLMMNLLHRVNIPCISALLYSSTNIEDNNHARNLLYIKDDKYHLNGYFTADATTYKDRSNALITSNYFRRMLMDREEHFSTCPQYDTTITYATLFQDMDCLRDTFKNDTDKKFFLDSILSFDPELYGMLVNLDINNPEDIENWKKYVYHKMESVSYKNTCLLNAAVVVKSKIYKNITNEDLQKLKIFYFCSAPTLYNDNYCQLAFFPEFLEMYSDYTFEQIREKFQLNCYDIMKMITKAIWQDVEDFSVFVKVVEDRMILLRQFSSFILENQDALETQGYVYHFDYDNTRLLKLEFPAIVFTNKTLSEIFETLTMQKNQFLAYYSGLPNQKL